MSVAGLRRVPNNNGRPGKIMPPPEVHEQGRRARGGRNVQPVSRMLRDKLPVRHCWCDKLANCRPHPRVELPLSSRSFDADIPRYTRAECQGALAGWRFPQAWCYAQYPLPGVRAVRRSVAISARCPAGLRSCLVT